MGGFLHGLNIPHKDARKVEESSGHYSVTYELEESERRKIRTIKVAERFETGDLFFYIRRFCDMTGR